jgi:hypothetical protein
LIFGTVTLKKVKRPASPVIDLKNYSGFYLPSKKDTLLQTMEIREKDNKLFRFAETAPDPAQRNIELIALTDNIFIYADKSMRSLEFILDSKKEVTSCILRRYEGVYTLTKKK